jgi:hypothetical protein
MAENIPGLIICRAGWQQYGEEAMSLRIIMAMPDKRKLLS